MQHRGAARLAPGRVRPYVAAVSVSDTELLRAEFDGTPGRDRIDVHYQPVMDLLGGELVAVEALARWRHPARGVVPAAEFVPLAEQAGLIRDLDLRVLARACRQATEWQGVAGPASRPRLSVNIGAGHLARPDFADHVRATVDGSGLDPALVVLELDADRLADPTPDGVPPDGLTPSGPGTRTQLQALRDHGLRIALAGLGAPGTSLRGLADLPVDILKLDRRLVADLETNPYAATVADAVLRLGQVLRVDTIATGIENPAQAGRLAMIGFATGQGHHFARAMRAEQVRDLLTLNSVVSGLAGIRV